MKKITTLLDKLNLIYYEYDAATNTLFKDTKFNKDEIYKEKIKVTYALTTSGYYFFVDENESIVISKKIIVENHIVLRIPNENIDSLVRELNKLILFLDYRIIDTFCFTIGLLLLPDK